MSSANGLIALLEEPQNELKKYALEQLNNIVPENWAEVAYSIQKVYVKEPKKKRERDKKSFQKPLIICFLFLPKSKYSASCCVRTKSLKRDSWPLLWPRR